MIVNAKSTTGHSSKYFHSIPLSQVKPSGPITLFRAFFANWHPLPQLTEKSITASRSSDFY
jgi:hypothetical protein